MNHHDDQSQPVANRCSLGAPGGAGGGISGGAGQLNTPKRPVAFGDGQLVNGSLMAGEN